MNNMNKFVKVVALFLIVMQCILMIPEIPLELEAHALPSDLNLTPVIGAPLGISV